MAIDLLDTYGAGRVVVDGPNPRGTFKDSTFAGAFDGTPYQYAWVRDMWAFLEILLDKASITATGTPDTAAAGQRYEALRKIARDLFPLWDGAHTYGKAFLVIASDEKLYQSLQGANLNNNPVSTTGWWREFTAFGDATTTEKGVVELATPAENAAGTSDLVIPTSKGIREAFNATGSAPVFACRAWINFNGTGTITIRGSGNVDSIVDLGTGEYRVNFTVPMQDINYAVVITAGTSIITNTNRLGGIYEYTVDSISFHTRNAANAAVTDTEFVNVAVFR